jgi:heme/copper-type cytochrome/quinol oxidase subunit 2
MRRIRRSTVVSTKTEYQPLHQLDQSGYFPPAYQQQGYTQQGHEQRFEPLKQPLITTTPLQTTTRKRASFFIGIALGTVAVIMWFVTAFTLVFHWRLPSTGNQRTETYLQDPRVTADPSVLGALPSSCVDYLKSTSLQGQGMYSESFDQLLSAGIATLQFIIVSLAAVTICWRVFRKNPSASTENFKNCLSSTLTSLVIAIVGTALYIGINSWQKHSVSYSYTTNTATTGGCTFAFVEMDGTLGYWDVSYELGFRIGMSALGAA